MEETELIIKELKAIRNGIVKTQKSYDKAMGFYWDWMGKIIKDSQKTNKATEEKK